MIHSSSPLPAWREGTLPRRRSQVREESRRRTTPAETLRGRKEKLPRSGLVQQDFCGSSVSNEADRLHLSSLQGSLSTTLMCTILLVPTSDNTERGVAAQQHFGAAASTSPEDTPRGGQTSSTPRWAGSGPRGGCA